MSLVKALFENGTARKALPTLRALFLAAWAITAHGQIVTVTPTFNNLGLSVDFATPPGPTAVEMSIRKDGDTDYRKIHPLSRTSPTRFAGSAFMLNDGTAYSLLLESSAFASNLVVTASTRPDRFPDAANGTYHVSATGGSDANDGKSFATAFKTLGQALSLAGPGDNVLIYGGRYYEGELHAPRSGSPNAPIVIRCAEGQTVVLDGTDTDFVPAWVVFDAPNAVYRTPSDRQPVNAYLNGGHLFHYKRLSDLSANKWNQPGGYFADGKHIYVRFPGGGPPGANVVTIPAHTTGIVIDRKSHIQIRGLTFCYYGYGTYHRGIYIDGGDYNLVDSCIFHHNVLGVGLKRAADFNTIQHCTFSESPIDQWSWPAVKSGGIGYESGGVAIYGSDQASRGTVIRFNIFSNMFDGPHICSQYAAGPTTDLDYHGNIMTGCRDDCVETDGAGSNIRIYGNVMRDFLTGVSVAPADGGPFYIFRNVLSGWHDVGRYEGYPFKFNVGSSLAIEWVHIYHNTCYTDVAGQDGFLFKQYSDWTNIVSRNNIYAGTEYALESWSSINPVDFDYDNLHTTHATRFIKWAGSSHGTLGAFTSATGQESHGMSVEPGFADAAKEDFHLDVKSPLIDKGVAIPGINDDYLGSAPDIGAFEFGTVQPATQRSTR